MGSDKEHKNTNRMMDQERRRQTAEHDQFKSYALPERHAEKKWADSARDDIYSGYKRFSTGEALGDGGIGGGGGYSAKTFTPMTAATERAGLSGYSREAAGGYRNFANTGGWSAGDILGHRNRAIRTSDAFYDSLGTDIERQKKLSGGNLAFTGSLSRLARQKAQSGQNAVNDAEIDMQANIRENKLHGLGGLRGIGDTDTNVSMFNAGQGNEMNRYNTDWQNNAAMFNTSAANSAASSNASRASADAKWRAEMQLTGLGGMHDMYTSNPAELARYDDQLMRGRFGQGGMNNEALGTRAAYNPKGPSVWDRIMQGAGMAAGIGGGILTGGATTALGGLLPRDKPFVGTNVGYPTIPGRG